MIDDLVTRAAVIANNATVTLTALAGPAAAEKVLTAFITAYGQSLSDLRGRERAAVILYALADEITTGVAK